MTARIWDLSVRLNYASSETHTAKDCALPLHTDPIHGGQTATFLYTQIHIADKRDLPLHTDPHDRQTAIFHFTPHFALLPTPLLCMSSGAHPKSSLQKEARNKYIKL